MTYNGWTNYETWAVALWIDNEQGSHNQRREMAQETWDNAEATRYSTREEVALRDFADTLKDWVEEMAPDLGASLFSDLLSAALQEVDWREIAENWSEDIDKEAEEEEEDSEV